LYLCPNYAPPQSTTVVNRRFHSEPGNGWLPELFLKDVPTIRTHGSTALSLGSFRQQLHRRILAIGAWKGAVQCRLVTVKE
jgi:hypothetical protein